MVAKIREWTKYLYIAHLLKESCTWCIYLHIVIQSYDYTGHRKENKHKQCLVRQS